MLKCQKNVQNWQLCIIHQLSNSQTAGLWMRLNCLFQLLMPDSTGWVGDKVFTDHKSSHRFKISQLVQDLFYF